MRYTIIGGLNGVGKSTVYSTLTEAETCNLGKRINVDEIVAALGDWRDDKVQFMAGKQAVRRIKAYLTAGCDFHQESTLSGQTILNTVNEAKSRGYSIHLWYIYVDSVETAKQRVFTRVANGGHGVADEVIERRSLTTLTTLKKLVPLCDEVKLYDNTVAFNLVAKIVGGNLKIFDKSIPQKILSCLTE